MNTSGAPSPKQFKAPIGPKRSRKSRPGKKTRPKPPKEAVDPKLPASPRPKAVCPYTASTELEDFHLRSLINHCKFPPAYECGCTRLTNPADVTFITAATLTNVGPRFEWYGLAVRDEAFFHALISDTCAHYTYMTGLELPYKWIFFRHRGEAIRVVNQRIAQGRFDEGTINAIIIFAHQDVGRQPDCLSQKADGFVEF